MAEKILVTHILKALRKHGAWAFKVHGGPFQDAGIPDLIACYHGRFIGLEVKDPVTGYEATKLQLFTLQEITDHGGKTAVIRSVDEALNILAWLDEEHYGL